MDRGAVAHSWWHQPECGNKPVLSFCVGGIFQPLYVFCTTVLATYSHLFTLFRPTEVEKRDSQKESAEGRDTHGAAEGASDRDRGVE